MWTKKERGGRTGEGVTVGVFFFFDAIDADVVSQDDDPENYLEPPLRRSGGSYFNVRPDTVERRPYRPVGS